MEGRENNISNWYATRIITDRNYVTKLVTGRGIRTYSAAAMPTLLFLCCTEKQIGDLVTECYGKLFFYFDAERRAPGKIDDRQMKSFMLVTSASPSEFITLDVTDPEFLSGQKVRVTGGTFKGAEGVVKRVKGDRRLIVEIRGVTVIATSFIHPSLLEKIEG